MTLKMGSLLCELIPESLWWPQCSLIATHSLAVKCKTSVNLYSQLEFTEENWQLACVDLAPGLLPFMPVAT